MINFNGTTKRRNINLGGNRRPMKGSNKTYLDQLSQERTKRSRAKEELNAAIKLQSFIRRYQVLKLEADIIRKDWTTKSDDPNLVLQEFSFFSSTLSTDINPILIQLQHFCIDENITRANDITLKNFFKSLIRLYGRLQRDRKLSHQLSLELIADITTSIFPIISILDIDDNTFKNLLQFLNETLEKYSIGDRKLVVRALILYSGYDLLALVKFFSLDYSVSLVGPLTKSDLTKIENMRDWIASPAFQDFLAPDEMLFQFLGNFISLIDLYHLKGSKTVKALSNLLRAIQSDVAFINDLEDNDVVMGEDEHSILVADFNLSEKLEYLYSKEFMSSLFKDLENSSSIDDFSSFLYSSLHLLNALSSRPTNTRLKNKTLTSLIVSSSCTDLIKNWFYEILITDTSAQKLINDQASFSNPSLSSSKKWWETLYLFEEVFSYILMFQNDSNIEKFGDGKILPPFMAFLKGFCLYIAINEKSVKINWTDQPINDNSFDYLCELSLKLFNQLYLRNTRMKFVDDSFWKMNASVGASLRFNIETVVNLLKINNTGSLEEEEALGKTLKRSRLRDEPNTALNILVYMPFLIPFETRAQIFQGLIESDKLRKLNNYRSFFLEPQTKLRATISRENLLFDAFEAFGDVRGEQFKSKLDVTFVNQFGPESGIDGGGLTKEFLTSVCKDGFQYVNFDDETLNNDSISSSYNFFKQTPGTYQIYPSTDFYWRRKYQQQQTRLNNGILDPKYDFSEENQFFAKMMRFLGMVIGKCLYENVLLDISFAPFFLSKWCSIENVESSNPQYKNSFDDLKYLDAKLYENLIKLLSLSDEELSDLELYFSISEKLPHQSEIVTVDLIPNGSSTQVDQTNKLQYVYAVANFKLNTLINAQSKYFLNGLFEIIQPSWLNLFSHIELLMLVSGGEKPVDIDDLKVNTVYGGYLENDLTIKYFWEVVEEFTPEERSKLIKFATSSSKAPLLGFKDLVPKFGIRDALDVNRLPTASTCVNLLKLPNYRNKQVLKEKLLYAINAESRFDLS